MGAHGDAVRLLKQSGTDYLRTLAFLEPVNLSSIDANTCQACESRHSWTGRRRNAGYVDCPSGYIPDATPSYYVQTGCCQASMQVIE